jgi:hypothetical protein
MYKIAKLSVFATLSCGVNIGFGCLQLKLKLIIFTLEGRQSNLLDNISDLLNLTFRLTALRVCL